PLDQIREPDMLLGYHVEPLLAVISLLYLIHDGPETLLWLQTVGIALGAVPLYLLARRRFAAGAGAGGAAGLEDVAGQRDTTGPKDAAGPKATAGAEGGPLPWSQALLPAVFVLIYLLAPALQAANLSDFHAVALSPALLLAAFFCLETDRPWGFVAFAFLAAMCKEEVGLLVAMMGLWAALVRRRRWLGLATVVAGAGWSLLCVLVIMPHYSGLSNSAFVVRYGQFGAGAGEVLRNVVAHPSLLLDWLRRPAVMRYLRDLWLNSGGLAILHPVASALALPAVAINALSRYDWMHSGGGHYSASIVPFLLIGAVYGVDWLARRAADVARRRWGREGAGVYRAVGLGLAGAGLMVALAFHYQNGITPPARRFVLEPVTEHARRAAPLIQHVNDLPPEVPISAGSNLYPQVAHRQRVYLFPTVSDAEFVLLDVTGPGSPVGAGQQRTLVRDLLDYGQFGVAAADDGILLLERGLADYRLAPSFYDAFDAGDAVPRHPVGADFAGLLRLEGFDRTVRPVVRPEEVVQITTYWQALAPLDDELRLVFYFWDEAGTLVRVQPEDQAVHWYPTWLWEPGQRVRISLPPLPVGDLAHVGVAVLYPGAGEGDVEGRVRPITAAAGQRLSLWDQDSIVELIEP
ncbi:MAG: DUF2079 domain-containing protein, partial [Anaerolineae bacterium]